jgi:hypothetical protein
MGGIMAEPDEDLAPSDHLTPEERDPEAPEADAAEQAAVAGPSDEDDRISDSLEVNEADAIDQARAVSLDDDYR